MKKKKVGRKAKYKRRKEVEKIKRRMCTKIKFGKKKKSVPKKRKYKMGNVVEKKKEKKEKKEGRKSKKRVCFRIKG